MWRIWIFCTPTSAKMWKNLCTIVLIKWGGTFRRPNVVVLCFSDLSLQKSLSPIAPNCRTFSNLSKHTTSRHTIVGKTSRKLWITWILSSKHTTPLTSCSFLQGFWGRLLKSSLLPALKISTHSLWKRGTTSYPRKFRLILVTVFLLEPLSTPWMVPSVFSSMPAVYLITTERKVLGSTRHRELAKPARLMSLSPPLLLLPLPLPIHPNQNVGIVWAFLVVPTYVTIYGNVLIVATETSSRRTDRPSRSRRRRRRRMIKTTKTIWPNRLLTVVPTSSVLPSLLNKCIASLILFWWSGIQLPKCWTRSLHQTAASSRLSTWIHLLLSTSRLLLWNPLLPWRFPKPPNLLLPCLSCWNQRNWRSLPLGTSCCQPSRHMRSLPNDGYGIVSVFFASFFVP